MDCAEIKVEMAEEGLLRHLHITEEGDTTEGATAKKEADITSAFSVLSCSDDSALRKEEEQKREEDAAREMYLEEQSLKNQQKDLKERDEKAEDTGNMSDGQKTDDSKSDGQTLEMMRMHEKPETSSNTEDKKVKTNDPQVDVKSFNSSEEKPEGERKKVCGLLHNPCCYCFCSQAVCVSIVFTLSNIHCELYEKNNLPVEKSSYDFVTEHVGVRRS